MQWLNMKNKKLHIINELLNEFDTGRTTNDTNQLISDLDVLHSRVCNISEQYPKNDIFKSILDFIATEINFTIENELNRLDNKEVQNG